MNKEKFNQITMWQFTMKYFSMLHIITEYQNVTEVKNLRRAEQKLQSSLAIAVFPDRWQSQGNNL